MKRSEMIEKFAIYMYNDWTIDEDKERNIPRCTADDLIRFLENHGMLPPTRPAQAGEWSNLTQEFLDEHEFTENKWESEDEKKGPPDDWTYEGSSL